MPELFLQVPQPLREDLRDWLTQVLAEGEASEREGLYLPTGADEDLRDTWLDELRVARRDDLAMLLGLLEEAGFGEKNVTLEPEVAEGIIRGAAAARLHLRERVLKPIADEQLENGDWTPTDLPSSGQWAYFAYHLLAAVQELLIYQTTGVSDSV